MEISPIGSWLKAPSRFYSREIYRAIILHRDLFHFLSAASHLIFHECVLTPSLHSWRSWRSRFRLVLAEICDVAGRGLSSSLAIFVYHRRRHRRKNDHEKWDLDARRLVFAAWKSWVLFFKIVTRSSVNFVQRSILRIHAHLRRVPVRHTRETGFSFAKKPFAEFYEGIFGTPRNLGTFNILDPVRCYIERDGGNLAWTIRKSKYRLVLCVPNSNLEVTKCVPSL